MSYYLLPRVSIHTFNFIDYFSSDSIPECIISNSLSSYLYEIKQKIESNEREWDIYKKYTNPYEYIHTNIPNTKNSICKIKPISRAFFKLIEIYNTHNILPNDNTPIKSFHLAEGPGGFIEATTFLRHNTNDIYYGMTLLEEKNINVPGWNKLIFY